MLFRYLIRVRVSAGSIRPTGALLYEKHYLAFGAQHNSLG